MRFGYAACCFLLSVSVICSPIGSGTADFEQIDSLRLGDFSGGGVLRRGFLIFESGPGLLGPAAGFELGSEPGSESGSEPEPEPEPGSEPGSEPASDSESEPLFFEKPFADYNTVEGLLLSVLIVLLAGLVFKLIGGILYG